MRLDSHASKLASGLRINRAADDAAGLAISENLRADIRSLAQAKRNTNDAVAMIQVAEGGLEEVSAIMVRLKELAVQAASDTIGNSERGYLNREFMALKDEVDRIVLSTEFNGTRLLIGEGDGVAEELLEGHNPPPLEMQVGKDYIEPPDAIDSPNPVNIIKVDMATLDARTDGSRGLDIGSSADEDGTRVDFKELAQNSIVRLDNALEKVASYRSRLGAYQNRLTSTDRNLGIQIENLSEARSRIVDADFAQETAEFTKFNILVQAGTSVLSQANQFPSAALELIKAV